MRVGSCEHDNLSKAKTTKIMNSNFQTNPILNDKTQKNIQYKKQREKKKLESLRLTYQTCDLGHEIRINL